MKVKTKCKCIPITVDLNLQWKIPRNRSCVVLHHSAAVEPTACAALLGFRLPEGYLFWGWSFSRDSVCSTLTQVHVFLPLCCSLMPAEAWCIQSRPEQALPCRDGGQIRPRGARWAPAYCRASSRAPALRPSASCSPGCTQLMWLLPSMHRCPPPPPPALLLHPSLLPAPGQAT